MTVALLPNCPFQHPRPSIYTLIVVSRYRMFPSSSPERAGFLYQLFTFPSERPNVILCKTYEYNKNVGIVLCFEITDRAADRLSMPVLGYKVAFVGHPFLRLSPLIRSVDFSESNHTSRAQNGACVLYSGDLSPLSAANSVETLESFRVKGYLANTVFEFTQFFFHFLTLVSEAKETSFPD